MLSTVKEFNHVELLHDAIPHDRVQWPVHDLVCLEIPAKILVFRSMRPTSCSHLLINRKQAMVKTVPAKILVFESSIVDSDQKVKSLSAFHFAHATGT